MRFFVRQFDAMDCGPACLCMIAAYYKRRYRLGQLRKECCIGKNGVSLLGISHAAEKIGFQVANGKLNFNSLVKNAVLPCIVHWNQNHFVVVYRIKRKNKGYVVYIADPAKGKIKYTEEEFCSHWMKIDGKEEQKGIILLLQPTPLFYTRKEESTVIFNRFQFLRKYFSAYKWYWGQLILSFLVGSILLLVFPFLTQAIVDIGINGKDIHFIYLILVAQSMLLLGSTAIRFVQSKLLLHISARIDIALISDFFLKLMKLPMKFFETKLLGDILQRIEDHKRVENFLTSQVLSLFFSLFTSFILSCVLFIYSFPIFMVFMSGSIVYAIWLIVFLKKRKAIDYKYFDQQGKNRNLVYQLINGMQEIKLQGCEERKRLEWEDCQAGLFKINLEALSLGQTQEAGGILIHELLNMGITVLAATFVVEGHLTFGMMLAVQYIIGQLNGPVRQVTGFLYRWQDLNISLDRINEVHVLENEEDVNREMKEIPFDDYSIHINDLSFTYNELIPEYVLNNINLSIPKDKVTAIVGGSGGGKTTLIKLLLGYYLPTKGQIKIGGINLEELNLSWWRSLCGVVMQDGYLFSDTIAKNIAISDDTPNLDRIKYAARVANISGYIESLPLGYDTVIGQDGQGVSQGQKQRILIARVVYKNPPFLFFDEATNALDANNEKEIINSLASFYKNKTVVIIAHRLSTVKYADQIIVLDKGKIAEVGKHKDLIAWKGKYYELVKNQLEN